MLEKITMRAGGGERPSLRDLQALACRDGSGSLSFVHLLAPPLYSSLPGRGKSRGPWVAHLQAPQKPLWLAKELFDLKFVSRQQSLNTQMCV